LKKQGQKIHLKMKMNKKDPVKYRKLVNQFRIEWVEPTKDKAIQIVDSAQNFSMWLDKKGFKIKKN